MGFALGRPGAHRHRAVHGHPRCRDRERRASFDQVRSQLLRHEPAMGDLRLRDPLRRDAAPRRAARRPAWPAAPVHGGARALLLQLAPLRPRLVGSLADRLPRLAGPRWSAARSRRALAADDDLRRGPRAEHRARDLRSGFGERRGGRRAARRAAHLVPELVVDLLHQRSGRARRDRAHAAAPA